VLLACLLVTAGAAGPATQSASALQFGNFGECDALDYAVFISSSGLVTSDDCTLRYDDSEASTHLDYYQQGETLRDRNDGFHASYSNFGEDTTSVAWSKAKLEIVNNLNAGNSSSVTMGEANETVRDYYTAQQREYLQMYSRGAQQAKYAYQTNSSYVSASADASYVGYATVEVTLINGSTTNITTYIANDGGANWLMVPVPESKATVLNASKSSYDLHQADDYPDVVDVLYTAPSSDYSTVEAITLMDWWDGNQRFYSQSQQVQDNVAAYVPDVYDQYQQGELNTTDIVDPQTLASQAASDYNDSGYYSYAATNLASLGYSGNLSSAVEVSTANGTMSGTLFYTGDDVSNFTVNETYDPSTMNGSVFMAVQDGENGTIRELGTFTVESATNPETGESMQEVGVEEYTYESTNASKLGNELDRLAELRDEYESMESSGTGTGDSGSGSSQNLLLVLLAGAAGAAILIGRDGSGGGNGGR